MDKKFSIKSIEYDLRSIYNVNLIHKLLYSTIFIDVSIVFHYKCLCEVSVTLDSFFGFLLYGLNIL